MAHFCFPPHIIATVLYASTMNFFHSKSSDESIEDTEADQNALVEELECPVCLWYIVPPIPLCENGHSVCPTCRQKLQNCPMCRYPFSDARCILLENITRRIRYPCKHRNVGCRSTDILERIKSHEEQCTHQQLKCPFSIIAYDNCPWKGRVFAIKYHIENKHNRPKNKTIVGRKHYGRLECDDTVSDMVWYQAIFALGQTFFRLCRFMDNNMHFSVLYVGFGMNANNYKFKVTLRSQDISYSDSISATTISYLTDVDNIFINRNGAVFSSDVWRKYLDSRNCLTFKIKIFMDVTQ